MCAITELEEQSLGGPGEVVDKPRPEEVPRGSGSEDEGDEEPSAEGMLLVADKNGGGYAKDLLGMITHHQKVALDYIYKKANSFQSTNFGRILTETSQPAHALTVVGVLLVAYMVIHHQRSHHITANAPPRSPFMSSLFLISVSIHVGAQFWMTFISGLALYFSLPRHAFGDVQKVLFPKYFTLNTILSALTLVSFHRLHKGTVWQPRHWVQLSAIGTCFLLELIVRVYAVPLVVELMTAKIALERRVPGVGSEVGCNRVLGGSGGALSRCPFYNRLHSNFRRLHSIVAAVNIATMACTALQLVYIQQSFSCL